MKGLDLRKFKKLHANDTHTTLKHPDGHEIKIAHSRLKPEMAKQLADLPKFADGGIVDSMVKSVKSAFTEDPPKKPKSTTTTPVPELDKKKAKDFSGVFNAGFAKGGTVPRYNQGTSGIMALTPDQKAYQPTGEELLQNTLSPDPEQLTRQGVKPNADLQYQDAYERGLAFQKMNNAGIPESMQQQFALDNVSKMKDSDVSSETAALRAKQTAAQKSGQDIQAQNAQRAKLGMAALPMPKGSQMPAADLPVAGGPQVEGLQAAATGQHSGLGMGDDQISGIRNEAAAIGAQGRAESAAAEQYIGREAETLRHYQQQTTQITHEIDAVTNDYMEGKIDPTRFFDSKSQLGKVSTVIGLLLGGIGGGMTHQENPALKFLNQQIDRDVDAQKANMSKQGNLINILNQKLGNVKDATSMAKNMYMNIYAAKITKAAADSKDPLAQARAQQAIGVIRFEQQKLLGQTAQSQAMAKMNSSDKVRFDSAKMGMLAANDMDRALASGDNTFSIVGDNNYTESMRRYAEAFGRMQSGGAINKDEENRFVAMAPGATDNKQMQQRKLLKMKDMFQSRMQTLGIDPRMAIPTSSNVTQRSK